MPEPDTVRGLLAEGAALIDGGGNGDSAWLDACLILAHLAGWDRPRLLASLNQPSAALPAAAAADGAAAFKALCAKRGAGYPVAYIRGRKEFFGRDFLVDESVLVPRPETEILVEWLIEDFRNGGPAGALVDCCTGSGCIAVTLGLELGRPVLATDLSGAALATASRNAERLGAAVEFVRADLLAGVAAPPQGLAAVAANPPYVPSAESRAAAAAWREPVMALDGGPDGLDLIRRLAGQAASLLPEGRCLYLEYGDGQTAALRRILESAGFGEVAVRPDLAGLDRIVRARRCR